jgi:hypothetical protein
MHGQQNPPISEGLEIAGKGTFKFNIKDNKGRQHTIRIKNSLYVPDMRRFLLSPQHWAQEAGDEKTWMETKRKRPYDCVLHWNGGKKTIPHQPLTNVPVFYTALSSTRYRAFTATFKAMETSFFQREKVLQFPVAKICWTILILLNSSQKRTSVTRKKTRQRMRE